MPSLIPKDGIGSLTSSGEKKAGEATLWGQTTSASTWHWCKASAHAIRGMSVNLNNIVACCERLSVVFAEHGDSHGSTSSFGLFAYFITVDKRCMRVTQITLLAKRCVDALVEQVE